MTHEKRLELAKRYRRELVAEKNDLVKRFENIKRAFAAVSGVPTLGKLTEFYGAIKAAMIGLP